MGTDNGFKDNVAEFARVLKNDACLVCSVPKKSCFIYNSGIELNPGYVRIEDDYFNVRNGEIMRCFSGEDDIIKEFEPYFKEFIFASIQDDWFGLSYHWHVFVGTKR